MKAILAMVALVVGFTVVGMMFGKRGRSYSIRVRGPAIRIRPGVPSVP